ncbi:MAG: alpha/beta hydrolase [Leptospiraceae bacterium]|nr:alpha/beta hydrolase [Leptospiraceae bacterium]
MRNFLFISILLFSHCSFFGKDKTSSPVPIEFHKYKIDAATLRYAEVNSKKQKLILFVHGSPGSWDAFSKYLEDPDLQKEAILISIDRYGYGGSMAGSPELSLGNQARSIKPILDKYALPILVVGHSYGGPVALQLAMDYPAQVTGLLLLAPSIDPDLEDILWYQRFADWKIIRWILPSFIDVSNQEILPLRFELQKMIHLWKDLKTPMVVIQGDNDSLVPPGNADYAERMYPDKSKLKIVRGDMNHFLLWNEYELVKREILELIKDYPR